MSNTGREKPDACVAAAPSRKAQTARLPDYLRTHIINQPQRWLRRMQSVSQNRVKKHRIEIADPNEREKNQDTFHCHTS